MKLLKEVYGIRIVDTQGKTVGFVSYDELLQVAGERAVRREPRDFSGPEYVPPSKDTLRPTINCF